MNSQDFTAKKVEDAIKEGLSVMGISQNQAIIEIIDQGGIFKKAKVRITSKGTEGQKALAFIEGLMEIMDLKSTLELTEDETNANIEIISVNSGTIIGHRGDVLDSIQYLASIVANEGKDEYKRIVVDCENYRARRVETLETLAKRMADKAVETERRVKLEPMNAFERRVIHAFLTNDTRVTTSSYGEEPYRYLSITPKNMKPFTPREGNGGQKRDFNRDGNRGGGFNRDNNRGGGFNRDNKPAFNKDKEGEFNRGRSSGDGVSDRRASYDRPDSRPQRTEDSETRVEKPREFVAKPKTSFSDFAFLGNSNDNNKSEKSDD